MGISHRSQGGPFHYEFLDRPEDEYRRHRSRCIYFNKNKEYCSIKEKMCYGACNCCYYKEKSDYVRRRNSRKELYNKLFPSQYRESSILDVLELESSKPNRNIDNVNNKENKSINKDEYDGMLPTYSGNQVKKSYVTRVFTYRTKDGEQILLCRRQEKKQTTYKLREKTVFTLSNTKDFKKLIKREPIECYGKTFYFLKYEYASVSIYEQMKNSNKVKNNKSVCINKNNAKNTNKR